MLKNYPLCILYKEMISMNSKSIFTDSTVVRDPRTGRPLKIRGEFELPVFDTTGYPLKAFLFANAEELSLSKQVNDLNKIQDVETPTGRVVRFEQMKDGIPIFGTEVQIRLDRSSRVKQIDLANVPQDNVVKLKGDQKRITANEAIKLACDSLGEHTLRQDIASPKEI
jgi:Zn-dependent metalloprotease